MPVVVLRNRMIRPRSSSWLYNHAVETAPCPVCRSGEPQAESQLPSADKPTKSRGGSKTCPRFSQWRGSLYLDVEFACIGLTDGIKLQGTQEASDVEFISTAYEVLQKFIHLPAEHRRCR